MLNEQLQKQIEQEGKSRKIGFENLVLATVADSEYCIGAEKYAALWQAAEEKAARYEKALKEIVNPIAYLQRKAEEQGCVLNGMAFEVANDPAFIKNIATEALTSKTSEDEKAG